MCRWFAYLSNSEPCLLEDVLIDPAHSLAHQVSEHYLPGLLHREPDEDVRATEKESRGTEGSSLSTSNTSELTWMTKW